MKKHLELSEFLTNVRRLEIVAAKNAYSVLSGDYKTVILGNGIDFQEARKYVIGESIRHIDWNMTARLGEPYVKIYNEERMREVFIALDVSSSMYAGWQDRTKIEFAVEMAATLAYASISSKDKLGFILFDDSGIEVVEPSFGKRHLFQVLKKFYSLTLGEVKKKSGTDIRAAIHAVQKFKGRRFVIFILSDFLDRDVPDDLKYIRRVHDINMIHIYDPIEYENQRLLKFPIYSPEKDNWKGVCKINSVAKLSDSTQFLKREFMKYRIAYQPVSTIQDIGKKLREYFLIKKRIRW